MTALPSLVFAALAILAPTNNATVATLNAGHKAYFMAPRGERFLRLDNMTDRAKLERFGSVQEPVKIAWEGPTNAIYTLAVVSSAGERQGFAITNRTCVYLTNLGLGVKYRWMVKTGKVKSPVAHFTTETMPPRLLRADGLRNFRDLGGWKTEDGRRVKENMIFRSAGLRASSKMTGAVFRQKLHLGEQRISAQGILTLKKDFHIRTDLELRNDQETLGLTGSLLEPQAQWARVPFAAYDLIDDMTFGRLKFAAIFRIFTNERNYPVLFHCSGGRDRTGTLAFLLNGLLGVAEDDLCRDWETSLFAGQGKKFNSELITRLLNYLRAMPGQTYREKVEAYVRSCGITDAEIEKFRKIMLE